MTAAPLYFAFLDGSLGYDCAACGGHCCHGLGFGLGRGALVPLLARHPQAAPFAQAAGGMATILTLADEGCWYLRGDGRCVVEAEDGRAAKPSVCRLFPFNRLHAVGGVTVVEPQLLNCPLEDRLGRGGVTFAELRAELGACGDLPVVPANGPAGLPDDWLDRERAVVELSGAHLDEPDPIVLCAAQVPSEADRLVRLRAWWRRSLGLDAEAIESEERLGRPLALLAPALRFSTLFHAAQGPYPKVAARLPSLLLGFALYSGLAARALGHGRPPGLRALAELFRGTVFQRELLARWDRPAWLDATPMASDLPPPVGAAHEALQRLLADGPRPLGEAFDAAAEPLVPWERHLLLRALADRLGSLRIG